MTDSNAGNIAFRWTRTFLDALQAHGVRHIIISPGSRSTPLTLAAASSDHFQKNVILDERSAGFTALGIGKATNTPAVLICTSGTALANYYPAVIEARQSGIPMILATADRPPHLRATGANQAIDQLKIFGDYPVFFHEVGEPSLESEDLDRLRLLGQQAVRLSREKRGPVHLNFPFRKPLEPEQNVLQDISTNAKPKTHFSKQGANTVLQLSDSLKQKISKAEKSLIIVGPLAPNDDTDSIAKLADALDSPIATESGIDHKNVISAFAGFLRNEELRIDLEPDLILRFGFQPTSKSLELGLKEWNSENHYHFASTQEWQDATYSGAERIPWMGQQIRWDDVGAPTNNSWLRQWKSAEDTFVNHYDHTIPKASQLTDGAIYDHLTPQITTEQFLMVSNSFPARDINLFGRHDANIPLYLNRGVSGIDGVTSTAIGLSLALDKPGVLFTGDLAFLHDTNALLNAKKVCNPLVIIVINNSGGSIFRMLPIEQHEEYFSNYFETPQSANIQQLARSYDIPHQVIKTLNELQDIQLGNWMRQHSGLSIIECKTDPDASMKLRKKLWDF